ncbi:hypothetical protein K1T71_003801 [Dendrolimus kikuchii]|uniref:Uncharacterized protein n=1 Tax=Dendrolimus kikuchii TaxID=765133 RepID=A0ACC1DAG8_9NEOP|nr:hypothetical protein K1T71_003801 [Dendrolimus kikuchii]
MNAAEMQFLDWPLGRSSIQVITFWVTLTLVNNINCKMRLVVILALASLASAKIQHDRYVLNSLSNRTRDESYLKKYSPDWTDLDTRPLPEWYDRAKIGIFLHWGVFSVPSFKSEWFWSDWKGGSLDCFNFMYKNYPPGFTYQEFAPMFTGEFFDANEWAQLFEKSGAKYIVLTSKHHEGFTLFPSKRSYSWNSVDVGPHRDIVGELSKAVRSQGLKFGVYHSLYEWFNPIYLEDKHTNFTARVYTDTKLWPDVKQLVNDYKPSVLWSDGDWEAHDDYWRSTDLIAWLYNESPVKDEIVVNDRWGIGIPGKHGDFYNYADRYNPGKLLAHKWENAFTVDSKSWGYRRNMKLSEIFSMEQLLEQIVTTVSCGGNALLNIGPTKEGTIVPIFQERLTSLGKWLEINGEAIYSTSPWLSQNDTLNGNVWYTCTKREFNAINPIAKPKPGDTVTAIYAIALRWPPSNVLVLRDVTSLLHSGNYQVEMLGNEGDYLNWSISNGDAKIRFPNKAAVKSEYAWALKISAK